jgi:hypothetical protein
VQQQLTTVEDSSVKKQCNIGCYNGVAAGDNSVTTNLPVEQQPRTLAIRTKETEIILRVCVCVLLNNGSDVQGNGYGVAA